MSLSNVSYFIFMTQSDMLFNFLYIYVMFLFFILGKFSLHQQQGREIERIKNGHYRKHILLNISLIFLFFLSFVFSTPSYELINIFPWDNINMSGGFYAVGHTTNFFNAFQLQQLQNEKKETTHNWIPTENFESSLDCDAKCF